MGLTQAQGACLRSAVCVQDARVGSALEGPGTVAEPFAAMLVDMFIGNDIIPELAQVCPCCNLCQGLYQLIIACSGGQHCCLAAACPTRHEFAAACVPSSLLVLMPASEA